MEHGNREYFFVEKAISGIMVERWKGGKVEGWRGGGEEFVDYGFVFSLFFLRTILDNVTTDVPFTYVVFECNLQPNAHICMKMQMPKNWV